MVKIRCFKRQCRNLLGVRCGKIRWLAYFFSFSLLFSSTHGSCTLSTSFLLSPSCTSPYISLSHSFHMRHYKRRKISLGFNVCFQIRDQLPRVLPSFFAYIQLGGNWIKRISTSQWPSFLYKD